MTRPPETQESRPRRRLPADQRRTALLDSARKTFIERGYSGASVRSIAERAGVTEAMIYRHFESKEDLFEEAISEPLQHAVERTKQLSLTPPASSDAHDVRTRSVLFIQDLVIAMREIAPMLGITLAADSERGQAFYRQRIEPALDTIAAVVRSNLALWTHREFDTDAVVRIVYGVAWFYAIDHRFGTRQQNSPEELAEELLRIIFDGLAERP